MATAFILGAGFTKAFFPEAPLMEGDYPIARLRARYANLPLAKAIIDTELQSARDGLVNLERLMTRVAAPMPYDSGSRDSAELAIILSDVREMFARMLDRARKTEGSDFPFLTRFATRCVEDGATCITFNYDDTLDESLWRVKEQTTTSDEPYWHPDGGYGFFCQPASVCIRSVDVVMDSAISVLLKLHGSVNWRVRRGSRPPYALTDIVHQELWLPDPDVDFYSDVAEVDRDRGMIENHLEPQPLLVAPVLDKSRIAQEPVFQTIWSMARSRLAKADEIIFIGYSFPVTDLAARFLFAEAIPAAKRSRITVVDARQPGTERRRLRENYEAVFGELSRTQFEWGGAANWIRNAYGA